MFERLLSDEGPNKCRVMGGVPQGSVLRPILLNVLYDGILRLPLRKEEQIIRYIDNIAVTIVAKELPQIQNICSETAQMPFKKARNFLDEKLKQW